MGFIFSFSPKWLATVKLSFSPLATWIFPFSFGVFINLVKLYTICQPVNWIVNYVIFFNKRFSFFSLVSKHHTWTISLIFEFKSTPTLIFIFLSKDSLQPTSHFLLFIFAPLYSFFFFLDQNLQVQLFFLFAIQMFLYFSFSFLCKWESTKVTNATNNLS